MKRKGHTQTTKRVVSVILSLFLALTMFAGITFATEAPDITDDPGFSGACTHDCEDGTCSYLDTGACDHECDEDCGGLASAEPSEPGETGGTNGTDGTDETDMTDDPDSSAAPEEGEGTPEPVTVSTQGADDSAVVSALETISALATGTSSDLADFVTGIVITDMNGAPVLPGDTTYLGQNYQFAITFEENPQLQLEYDTNGYLTYQLPSVLSVPNAIQTTPIYSGASNGNAIIGWYTISTSGLVQMWFDDVQLDGTPTPTGVNFIDYYSDVNITLDITAQLTGGGDVDFGNNVVIGIDPPEPPNPSLTMQKTSRYVPSEERIYYMVTITALNGSINNIVWTDTPMVDGTEGINNPVPGTWPNGAFSAFEFTINRVGAPPGSMMPMTIDWLSTDPAEFKYLFVYPAGYPLAGEPVELEPNDFITVRYFLDLQPLIANNDGIGGALAGMDPLNYNFTVNNEASVDGENATDGSPAGEVSDSTVDYVKKEFVMAKTGTWSGGNTIQWGVTIGDGTSVALNGGTVTDTHSGALMTLPANASGITITLYGYGGSQSVVTDLGNTSLFPFPPSTLTAYTFSFVVPDMSALPSLNVSPAPVGAVYKIEISYVTTMNPADMPIQGEPTEVFSNDVNFTFPAGGDSFDSSASVPVFMGNVGMTKTTSGICGNPTDGYYVDYVTTVNVPGGLGGQPLYIYDNLGLFSGGTGVPNLPNQAANNFAVSAVFTPDPATDPADPVDPALSYSGPVYYAANAWTLYFGESVDPGTPSTWQWQYDDPVTLTISYRMFIPAAEVASLQAGKQLQNAVYVINSMGNPDISAVGNSVGGVNTNDLWPIIKSAAVTGNPALFNYTVTIRGNYSSKGTPLLTEGKAPVYTDVFDSRMEYVENTFYIADATGNRYFVPTVDPLVPPNTLSVGLSDTTWQQYTGTYPNGTPVATLSPGWYALARNYVVHYQLKVIDVTDPLTGLVNTADIAVNPTNNECDFQNTATVTFTPQNLGKTMEAMEPGAARVNVSITINADGEYIFTNPGPDPSLVVAKDVLTNLSIFLNSVQFYTQTQVNGVWNGVWVAAPATSFNTGAAWSVTAVSPTEVDFIVPNMTPVMVKYQAQVLLAPGTPGTISNTVSIGDDSEQAEGSYTVSTAGVGAGAGRMFFRVFKKDPNDDNVGGARFSLYVTDITKKNAAGNYVPPASVPTQLTINGLLNTNFNFGLLSSLTTNAGGIGVFDNQWINSQQRLLYLLVETQAPDGFQAIGDTTYTYFTLAPAITPADIAALDAALDPSEVLYGGNVNQMTDFTTIINAFEGPAFSFRIIKEVRGLPEDVMNEHLKNFRVVVTDPLVNVTEYTLAQVRGPNGVLLTYDGLLGMGPFFIDEKNYEVPGYTVVTSPQLPIRTYLNADRVVVIRLTNTYTPIPVTPIPGRVHGAGALTGDFSNIVLWQLALLAAAIGLICILMWRRREKRGAGKS